MFIELGEGTNIHLFNINEIAAIEKWFTSELDQVYITLKNGKQITVYESYENVRGKIQEYKFPTTKAFFNVIR